MTDKPIVVTSVSTSQGIRDGVQDEAVQWSAVTICTEAAIVSQCRTFAVGVRKSKVRLCKSTENEV